MRSQLSFVLLTTILYTSHVRSLPNQVHFHTAQGHESTLAPDGDSVQTTFFTPPTSATHTLRTHAQTVYQPRFPSDIQRIRERSLRSQQSESIEWEKKEVLAPDVTDRLTLQEMAKMTGNAYARPGHSNWYNMSTRWNTSHEFGWEPDEDGFRGHVFVSENENIVVMSIKGTSLWTPVGDKTSKKDKLNDNLLFSCCCARVDWTWAWQTVCDCFSGGWRCDNTCLSASLVLDSLFYNVGVGLYMNLTATYPTSTIWLTGHSLGGALAALLGATFGVPTSLTALLPLFTHSPGERLASTRLHIPHAPGIPASEQPITHVWHTADPIPDGRCVGPKSLCAKGGYALETRCRNGKHIVYDTVARKKWAANIARHRIGVIINEVLDEDWDEDRAVPEAVPYDNCTECEKWSFGDYKL
ncbi:putative lipase atg15 [Ceratobasidium sp. 395]|nr:putative lipase atg15 [Ceratobasidium sp. 395]